MLSSPRGAVHWGKLFTYLPASNIYCKNSGYSCYSLLYFSISLPPFRALRACGCNTSPPGSCF